MRSNHYTMMARQLIKNSLKNAAVMEHESIGVAVSGGADSAALMIALAKVYQGDRAKLVNVITVDHQLQAETADVSKKVAAYAESLGFQAHVIPIEITSTKAGMESDARVARYNALEHAAKTLNLAVVMLGHTKTDQAEQVFLGLLRGSGTRSLSGIPETRAMYMRPFLNGLTREETEKICEENSYVFWSDPHNELKKYRRVAIRKLISAVETETGQPIVEPLVRTAKISREDADALDFFALKAEEKIIADDWAIASLKSEPIAIRKRLYRNELLRLAADSEKITFDLLNRIDDFVDNWHGQGLITVQGTIEVKREHNRLIFSNHG